MASQTRTVSSQISGSDRALAATLAAFSMFVVGYTAVRVLLTQPATNNAALTVTPHQAEIWSELGQ